MTMAPYDDEMGYDELGYEELGRAMVRRRAPVLRNAPPRGAALRMAFDRKRAEAGPQLRQFYMPFTAGTFAVGVGTLSLSAQPQRPFIGRRLIIDLARNGTTSNGLVTITNLAVGVDPQLVNNGSFPAGAFAPTAVGTDLGINAARGGDTITLALAISIVPTTTDTVAVSAGIIGNALD